MTTKCVYNMLEKFWQFSVRERSALFSKLERLGMSMQRIGLIQENIFAGWKNLEKSFLNSLNLMPGVLISRLLNKHQYDGF